MTPKNFGRYEIEYEICRGGMATVYRAHDPRFDRDVAIKTLPREFLHNPTFRTRFDLEAVTVAAVEHTAIVPVYDFGEEGGQPYLVMRYMPGGSLADRIAEGPIPVTDCVGILERIGSALDNAHRRGVIHRDLKPSNILFDQYGDAFLADFGIAKIAEAGAALTGSSIIGTPAYMSPEQARGEKNLDGRSDIYAMGSILFEMLTGKPPYEADTPIGLAVKHVTDPVPRLLDVKPDLPCDCESVIDRAMAKDRDRRFPTASEMALTLAAIAKSEREAESLAAPKTTAPPLPTEHMSPARQPFPSRLWIIGGVVLLLAIGGTIRFAGVFGTGARATSTATVSSISTQAVSNTPSVSVFTATPFLVPTEMNVPALKALTPTRTSTPTPTPVPSYTPTRTSTPMPTRTKVPTATHVQTATAAHSCVYDVELVQVRDRYLYWYPNSQPSFELLLRNSGTCRWSEGTELALVSDNPYGWPESWPVETPDVGEEVSVSVTLAAPGTPQTLLIAWRIRGPDGEFFGQEVTRALRIDWPTPTPISTEASVTPSSPPTEQSPPEQPPSEPPQPKPTTPTPVPPPPPTSTSPPPPSPTSPPPPPTAPPAP